VSGDDNLAVGARIKERRQQIGERFSHPGSRLDNCHAIALAKRAGNRFDCLALLVTRW